MNIQAGRHSSVMTQCGDYAVVTVNGKKYKHKGNCSVRVAGEQVYFNNELAESIAPWWKKLLKNK